MPFKSEEQRRYLWANEPEIARDWTDTYGSKIHAADGGIMNGLNRRHYVTGATGMSAQEMRELIKQNTGDALMNQGIEFNNPIGGLDQLAREAETTSPYLNLMNPAIKSDYYTDHGDFAGTYDPAFGQLEDWTEDTTTYPTEDPYSQASYDWRKIIPRLHQGNFYKNFGTDDSLTEEVTEDDPSGINLLPNDFNRNYQSEDANWRTRLKNKGSGIINYLLSGLGKAVDFPMGIMSSIAQGFPNNAQEQAMVDLYGGNTVTSGPMAGYNAASLFGKGLPYATQKRINKRQATLQKMKHWEDSRKRRFQKQTGLLEEELAKQNKALLDQANQVKTTYRPQAQDPGGRSVSNFSRTSPGGRMSQATSRAARGADDSGQGAMSGWKW